MFLAKNSSRETHFICFKLSNPIFIFFEFLIHCFCMLGYLSSTHEKGTNDENHLKWTTISMLDPSQYEFIEKKFNNAEKIPGKTRENHPLTILEKSSMRDEISEILCLIVWNCCSSLISGGWFSCKISIIIFQKIVEKRKKWHFLKTSKKGSLTMTILGINMCDNFNFFF